MPSTLVQRLKRSLAKFYGESQRQARADAVGIMLANSTPAEFAEDLKYGFAAVGRIVKAAGIKADYQALM